MTGERYQESEFIAEEIGERLDKALAARLGTLSRVQVQSLIRDELVTVDGRAVKASYRIEGGEVIRARIPLPEEELGPQPEPIALDILYEDECVAAINKPAGMVVHPAYGHTSGTLVNAVLARWPQIAGFSEPERAGIVHRLDKDTSGAILVAKTAAALESLRAQFKARTVAKRYLALVEGMLDTPDGLIDAPIGRDPGQRKRMAVVRNGREAVTEYHVLDAYVGFSLLEVLPHTGRTHQIRVHLAFVGHPVVGDTVYGRRKQSIKLKRHFLHAASLTFTRPDTGEPITVEAPLPVALQHILDELPR
ncbi:MAG TPA: RluA family pseudouridine synthase [Aggregatilineaceae bacterium]|nr:RluA family pseudouridine synthase [Aggregatilineaceae bacterium]